ncbi:hypothetical protein [Nitritalea halalkaliphila]|uniref:hypothetical protein n=1 Tax=Nitritalea halalkaliphila TaxID=590849 RepID=UPI00030E228D|nr:hypothetical protein [Nitritalea halalkaliphila]
MKEKIQALAKAYKQAFIADRRHLHAHPELSFEEHETAAYVEAALASYGIRAVERKAETGIVALIEGKNPEKKDDRPAR